MVTTMPLQPGLIGKTTGTFSSIRIVQCVVGGDMLLKHTDPAKNETVTMTAGQDAFIDGFNAVSISSGTFNLAR